MPDKVRLHPFPCSLLTNSQVCSFQGWFDLLWPYGVGGEEEDGDR